MKSSIFRSKVTFFHSELAEMGQKCVKIGLFRPKSAYFHGILATFGQYERLK